LPRQSPAVNVAGLAPGQASKELRALLKSAGIAVNCSAIPAIDLEAVGAWGGAMAQVLVPNPYFQSLYEQVLVPLGMPTLSPPAPYGVKTAGAWLAEIARACGREAAMEEAWHKAEAAAAPALAQLREEAARCRLGFVMAAEDYEALCDPAEMAGMPLLDLLVELGFGLAFMVYDSGGSPSPVLASAHARAAVVERFADQAALEALLRSDLCAAVYSDLYADERITAGGKAPFSLQFIEPGLEGALRSGERLLGACHLPFYRKYGRHGRTT
jgi:hypothetical protein